MGIKDKSKLSAMRSLIEERMESFKKCEKETKTKPYSKEALRLKMEQAAAEANALSEEQQEASDWLEDQIDLLQSQNDKLDEEIDKLQNKSTRKKRKKHDNENEEMSKMTERLEKNKWHVMQLKRCQDRIVQDEVDPMLYEEIRDDVEYYIESFEDDVLYDDDAMYHAITEAEEDPQRGKRRVVEEPEEEEEVVVLK